MSFGDDLDPLAIGIQHKGDMAHESLQKAYLEFIATVFQPLTCSLQIVHGDATMAETFTRFRIAACDFVVWVAFSAVVVGQLNDALAVCPVAAETLLLGCRWRESTNQTWRPDLGAC